MMPYHFLRYVSQRKKMKESFAKDVGKGDMQYYWHSTKGFSKNYKTTKGFGIITSENISRGNETTILER